MVLQQKTRGRQAKVKVQGKRQEKKEKEASVVVQNKIRR